MGRREEKRREEEREMIATEKGTERAKRGGVIGEKAGSTGKESERNGKDKKIEKKRRIKKRGKGE